jgi:hypothetical protein
MACEQAIFNNHHLKRRGRMKKIQFLVILLTAGFMLAVTTYGSFAAVAPVSPDLCDDAYGPLSVGSVTFGTTSGATLDEPPELFCDTSVTAPGVWFTVIGTGNTMTASTCNDGNSATGSADYDTKISIYCADCDDPTCVAGLDDTSGCNGFSTKLSWASRKGAEYLVLVHGFSSATGDFNLAILDDGVPTTPDISCVGIDIKPGSYPNSINMKKCDKGVIPVAILGDIGLDVTTVDVTSLAFGPSSASPAHDLTMPPVYSEHLYDVNMDTFLDLVSHYHCGETGIQEGDTEACLSGSTIGVVPGTNPNSNCFEARGETGCDDQACQDTVCAYDSFCCDVAWDGLCVDEARTDCTELLGTSCFYSHGYPGCDNQECEATVCGIDPFCCNSVWDSLCVDEAEDLCLVEFSINSCDSVRTVPKNQN